MLANRSARVMVLAVAGIAAAGSLFATGVYSNKASKLAWNRGAATPLVSRNPAAGKPLDGLTFLGHDAESFAAVGVSGEQFAQIVTKLTEFGTQNGRIVRDTALSCRTANANVQRLESRVRAGTATQDEKSLLGTARTGLTQAESARTALAASLHSLLGEVLSESQLTKLLCIEQSHGSGLPPAYRVVQRSEADTASLHFALLDARTAARLGHAESPASQSIIAAANEVTEIAAARTGVVESLATMKAAWKSVQQ